MKKLRIGVIFGGRSGEHEVSMASAASILDHLDRDRYEPVPIRIAKDGRWHLTTVTPGTLAPAVTLEQRDASPDDGVETYPLARPGTTTLLTVSRQPDGESGAALTRLALDVVFPVLHGPYGEDGTMQGLLELANVPYVGAGVLGSAVGMDKAVMKVLFAAHGLPIVRHVAFLGHEWRGGREDMVARVASTLGFPVFVKPANLGSSVGISRAQTAEEFVAGVELALQFDRKVVVEAAVPHAREIECAVLGNDVPEASVPGEIVPSRDFYDYESKYLDGSSREIIPAPLDEDQSAAVRRMALDAFRAVDCSGMARVDFLLDSRSGALFLNEINTIPGFTTISMYPKLWKATGLAYPALLDRLIALALERHAAKQHLRTSLT
ncbi:MAG: D-alanine--D-alanine ligase [Acidobacteria bacterium]|nr:D-alanine--D-alanine ligase [Acidobacteriota bacterium]